MIGAGIDKGAAYSSGAHKHWLTNTLVFHVRFTFGKRITALCAACCFNCCPEHGSWRGDFLDDASFLRNKQPYSMRRRK